MRRLRRGSNVGRPLLIMNESLALPIRLACAVASAAIVIAGSLAIRLSIDLTAVLLFPSIIFVFGVRSPRLVVIFGSVLVGATALFWGLFFANRQASTGGINIAMGALFTFVASVLGACAELAKLGSSPPSNTRPGGSR